MRDRDHTLSGRRCGGPRPRGIIEATGAGVFFPPPVSFDTHQVRFGTMAGVGPTERQLFIDRINLTATASGQSVPIAAQSVGDDRKTLVFMLLGSDGPTTPYMARAILARLTSITRFAPEIAEMGLSSEFDIYNMAAVLGFQQIVVTDGRAFAHQAHLTRN